MKSIVIVGSIIFFILSCKKDKSNEVIEDVVVPGVLTYCDTVTVSFSNQVQPIFIQNCSTSGCHDAATAESGYVFESHNQLSDHNNMGPALETIKHNPNFVPMPYFQDKLDDSLVQQIECWIAQGKLNN